MFLLLDNKTDVHSVTYPVLTNILTYVETALPTWCYSSTYNKDTLARGNSSGI